MIAIWFYLFMEQKELEKVNIKMKKIILLIALLATPAFAQEFGAPVAVSGNNVSLVAPDAAQSGVSLIAPNAAGVVQLSTGSAVREKIDGSGSKFFPISNPAAGTAASSTLTSGTIDSTVFWQRVTDAGAITGVILEAGTSHGQAVFVTVDKDAGGSVTFAAEATSNVCSGTGAVLAAGEGALFLWDATDTCWAELGT
jgi:hypothetical protein